MNKMFKEFKALLILFYSKFDRRGGFPEGE